MEIGSVYTSSGLASAESVYGADRQRRQAAQNARNPLAPVDSVSFSQEALELAAAMTGQREQIVSEDQGSSGGNNSSGGGDESAGAARMGGGGGSGSESESTDQVSKLEEAIKDLEAKVQGIMSGSATPETKQTQAQPYIQQISSLRQQLEQLKSQAAQGGK